MQKRYVSIQYNHGLMQHTYLDIEMQVAEFFFRESDFNKDVFCTYASTNAHDIILSRYNTTILTFNSFMFTCLQFNYVDKAPIYVDLLLILYMKNI